MCRFVPFVAYLRISDVVYFRAFLFAWSSGAGKKNWPTSPPFSLLPLELVVRMSPSYQKVAPNCPSVSYLSSMIAELTTCPALSHGIGQSERRLLFRSTNYGQYDLCITFLSCLDQERISLSPWVTTHTPRHLVKSPCVKLTSYREEQTRAPGSSSCPAEK